MVYVGVTTIVATSGKTPVFIAVNDGIEPEPINAKPMLEFVLVHVYEVVPPVLLETKLTDVTIPLQTTCETG